jgi:folate-dependent phosphoribosylglycinamide formyltransferase PurN
MPPGINKNPKIVILTGSDYRHQFFIHHLNTHFSISEVYIEKSDYPSPTPQSKEESIAWDWFFKRRGNYEKKLVARSSRLPSKNKPRTTYADEGELDSPDIIAQIKKNNPDFIAVFGTSILKEPFLKSFPNRLFNLHMGDPEFYRGSSCNFWPVHQEKLQHMSATIHRIDPGIDTGTILVRQAITLSRKDNEQTLLLKPVKLGTKLMIETIRRWQTGELRSTPKFRQGKLFKKSDFTPKAILEVKQMVESGRLKIHLQTQSSLVGIKKESTDITIQEGARSF